MKKIIILVVAAATLSVNAVHAQHRNDHKPVTKNSHTTVKKRKAQRRAGSSISRWVYPWQYPIL